MNTIKTLIVDDEPLARKGLSIRLRDFPHIEIVGLCENGEEALAECKRQQVDLMFLDIQMPGLSGLEVVKHLSDSAIGIPAIVFVTAFDQYAVKAFEIHALDYLLKPVDDNRLK